MEDKYIIYTKGGQLFAVNNETGHALLFEDIIKKLNEHGKMLEALKWFVNAMSDGSLIVFTDDDQHKAVRDDHKDNINKIESLVKDIES